MSNLPIVSPIREGLEEIADEPGVEKEPTGAPEQIDQTEADQSDAPGERDTGKGPLTI